MKTLELLVDIKNCDIGPRRLTFKHPKYHQIKSVSVRGVTKTVTFEYDDELAIANEFWDGEYVVLVSKDPTVQVKLVVGDFL